ncbi:hypothetical protein [Lampropedia cohaerens]|uniref:hypothetical protein n=1 Tax=Lampropedia cohaerens TaxID=1610491 RepID=UPI0012E36C6F|nr:hypothetical protein [Lampropedia cohaerens]
MMPRSLLALIGLGHAKNDVRQQAQREGKLAECDAWLLKLVMPTPCPIHLLRAAWTWCSWPDSTLRKSDFENQHNRQALAGEPAGFAGFVFNPDGLMVHLGAR